jgi:hypothetical protein
MIVKFLDDQLGCQGGGAAKRVVHDDDIFDAKNIIHGGDGL